MLNLKIKILLLNNTNRKIQNSMILFKLIKNIGLYTLLIIDNHPNYPISTVRIASDALFEQRSYSWH